jgi:hypothetical protein
MGYPAREYLADATGTRSISYDNRGNAIGETRPGGVSVAASYDGYGRSDICFTHVGQAKRRDLHDPDELGRLHTAVASDNASIRIDKDRVGKAEALNGVGDLFELLFRVRSRIVRARA